jgi:hypothetical protein
MDIFEEIKRIDLKDKRQITLNDEDDISLSVIRDGKTEFIFTLHYPKIGGGSISLSPSENICCFRIIQGKARKRLRCLQSTPPPSPRLSQFMIAAIITEKPRIIVFHRTKSY